MIRVEDDDAADRGGDPQLPPEPEPGDSSGNTSGSLPMQIGLPGLVGAGFGSLRRFPRLALALYALQLALSLGVAAMAALLLQRAFATRPLFDRAMEGDLAALISSLRSPGIGDLLASIVWMAVPIILFYAVISWFTTAGLIGVLLDRPHGRREVARWFGAAGASNFMAFTRLWLWSLVPTAIVLVAAAMGMAAVVEGLRRALDLGDLAAAMAVGLGPAFLLYWMLATAVDYARVDLVRHPGMSPLRALLRGFRLVLGRRLAMVHTGLYGLVFIGLGAGYLGLTAGGLVTGVAGLIVLRQLVSILRFAAHFGLVAGQVELGCAAMAPPLGRRRI